MSSSVIALMWLTIYYLLRSTSEKLTYGAVPITSWIIWLGEIGVLFYTMAIATISNGKMAGKIHSVSAVIFFVLWGIDMILINQAFFELKKT